MCFLGQTEQFHPRAADDETILRNLIFMMQTTGGDVAGLLPWILKMLSDHPRWVERVRQESPADGVADRIVMETLRLEQSEFLYRRTLEDITINGFLIPKGWLLRILVRESHRDPRIFENPDLFDPDRFLGPARPRSEYSPFGASRFACLGEHLTKVVSGIFVDEISRGFEWAVLADGPREFGGRHWNHWKPSSRWRIRIAPRSSAHGNGHLLTPWQ